MRAGQSAQRSICVSFRTVLSAKRSLVDKHLPSCGRAGLICRLILETASILLSSFLLPTPRANGLTRDEKNGLSVDTSACQTAAMISDEPLIEYQWLLTTSIPRDATTIRACSALVVCRIDWSNPTRITGGLMEWVQSGEKDFSGLVDWASNEEAH